MRPENAVSGNCGNEAKLAANASCSFNCEEGFENVSGSLEASCSAEGKLKNATADCQSTLGGHIDRSVSVGLCLDTFLYMDSRSSQENSGLWDGTWGS